MSPGLALLLGLEAAADVDDWKPSTRSDLDKSAPIVKQQQQPIQVEGEEEDYS
jgi:hypothetical protein